MTSYSVEDPFGLAGELSDEERLIASTVRDWVRRRFLPIVIDAWRAGGLPPELGPELGELGVLGMHLEGYGCAGASATAYGHACLELEAGDSGLRSLVRCRARWQCLRSTPSVRSSRRNAGSRPWRRVR